MTIKLFYIQIIIMNLYIKYSSQQKFEAPTTKLNCNSIKNCLECSNAHLDEINCKWKNKKCEFSKEKYSDIWFDNFKECEYDSITKKNIVEFCKIDISKNNNIIVNKLYGSETGFGISNIYCLYDIKDIKSDKNVVIKLSKSQESLYSNDNYALIINFKNGIKEIFNLDNKNYYFKRNNVKTIEFRYYSKDAKSENPFLVLIEYEKNYFILIKKFVIIIIISIILLCIIFFIIFYRWRISIDQETEKNYEKSKKQVKKKNKLNHHNKNNKTEQKKISIKDNNNIILKLNNTNSVRELKETDKTENIESLVYNNNVNGSCFINENLKSKNKTKSDERIEIKIQPIRKERRFNTNNNNFIKT